MGNADLPVDSGAQHVRAFEHAGWTLLARRGNGKHFLLKKPGHRVMLSIPDHKQVKRALLAHQIKAAGMTIEEYLTHWAER